MPGPARRHRGRAATAILASAALVALPTAADADAPGPKLLEPRAERLDALVCTDNLAESPLPPVLLVHGTGVTARENWSFGYEKVLAERGHAVCTVTLPNRAYGDVQRSVEYVVTAIRVIHRRSDEKLSIVGQSQCRSRPRR